MSNIFVGNLSVGASEESVRALFQTHGDVGRIKIVTDRGTGQRLGFGFVEMLDDEEREEAIRTVNGTNLGGCILLVNRACPNTGHVAGTKSDGIVLSVCGPMMRVAIRDCDDAMQFTFLDGQWFAEDGSVVTVTFLSPFGDNRFDTCLEVDSSPPMASVWVN